MEALEPGILHPGVVLLADLTATNYIAIGVLFAAGAWMLRWSQRNMRRAEERIRKLEQPLEHASNASPREAHAEVHLHDLARDLCGQLDTKIAIVNQLLHRADERIARLEELARSSPDKPRADDGLK